MQLNYDCVRDVLLFLETNLRYEENSTNLKSLSWNKIAKSTELSSKYPYEDIVYTLESLYNGGFINAPHFKRLPDGNIYIFDVNDITWSGHDLLDTIKNESVWQKTKDKIKECGKSGISIILSTAIEIGKDLVKEKLGLP